MYSKLRPTIPAPAPCRSGDALDRERAAAPNSLQPCHASPHVSCHERLAPAIWLAAAVTVAWSSVGWSRRRRGLFTWAARRSDRAPRTCVLESER